VDIKTQLKEMLISELKLVNVTPEQINNDSPLFGDNSTLGLDSLDAVELVVMIQKKFNIEISDRDTALKAFASINVLADFITKNRSAS
jgi:acyl carrier protein